ncbi:MAG TPA: serine/threonine-protein kinase [Candidatus Angelobacter sp.]|nr:serine/threonine-protein kinase [Candidatus Angelobacter sp.]
METLQQLGRYEILAELGRGAMGAVFRARDPKIDRTVAIKTISIPGPGAQDAEHFRQRFFREAQAAGRLSHPGIVTIYDVGEDEPSHTPFIVMECVQGQSLEALVASAAPGTMSHSAALELVRHVAEALDYAHSQGIVHRDIKPANILVTAAGQPKIADFGIAKVSVAEITLPGHVVGTPAYMSPEQLNGKPLDGRSDLFSLGVVAYWLLTGVKPFDGGSITEICVQVVTKDPLPASQLRADLNTDFDHVLSRALAKDPAMRYQSGQELAAEIEDLQAGRTPRSAARSQLTKTVVQAKVLPQPRRTSVLPSRSQAASPLLKDSAPRRNVFLYLLVAALVLLAVATGLFLSFGRSMPATLQIVGQYPFRSGEIYIWVDGDLRYHDELRGSGNSRLRSSRAPTADGEGIDLTLPVKAGRHLIRVQVNAPGQTYDHDTAIPGQFRPYSQKTLIVDFTSRTLDLKWE